MQLHLNFDVDAGWQIEIHERINCLGRWLGDVDQTLMGSHLELLTAVLVDMWSFKYSEAFLIGWQGDWPCYSSSGPDSGVENLLGRLIDYLTIVGLESNANALFLFGLSCSCHGAKGFPSYLPR